MAPPIRVALIGYGMAGKVFHAPLIAATDGLDLACIVSSDAAKVHSDWPHVRVDKMMETALADPAIDLIVLATPDHLHAPHARAALDAGKPVVIDKPFAPTLAEAEAVANHAAARGLMLSIFQNRRWDADFLTLKRLIAEGTLGEIVQFESHFDRLRPTRPARWQDNRAAGVWQDLGPHLVDQALHLFGLPRAVIADIAQQRTETSAPDYAHVILLYERLRVILHMSQSTHANGLRFAVHGTRASYIKHGLDVQEDQSKAGLRPDDAAWGIDPVAGTTTRKTDPGALDVITVETLRGDARAFYAGVRDALHGTAPNPVPPSEALNVMRVIDAACVSSARGATITLS